MDRLPPELIGRICRHLTVPEVKPLLTLSKAWQPEVERWSQVWKKCKINESQLQDFLRNYNSERLHYLENLVYNTILSPLEMSQEDQEKEGKEFETPPCRDSPEELKAMDEEFTRQVVSLFKTLKSLEDRSGSREQCDLRKFRLTIKSPTRHVDEWHCLHRKFVAWRVHLLSPETLPEISIIRALSMKQDSAGESHCEEPNGTSRRVDLKVLLDLVAKLPKLEYLESKLWHDEFVNNSSSESIKHYTKPWAGPRRDSRNDFATALEKFSAQNSLRELDLDFIHHWQGPDYIDQDQDLPNLIKPATYDPFSRSLRLFSYQLRKLHLTVLADETLFWPADENDDEPLWPNLQTLNVKFQLATPKGGWYFKGLKDEGKVTEGYEVSGSSYPPIGPDVNDEDQEVDDADAIGDWSDGEGGQFRVVPYDELLMPFLTAFAKAAKKMPVLERATLWTPLSFDGYAYDEDYDPQTFGVTTDMRGEVAWGIVYLAPGEECPSSLIDPGPGVTSHDSRQIWWKVGKWKPENEVHELFQKIGREQRGDKLVEYWEDNEHGKQLVPRAIFEPQYLPIF